MKQFYYAGKSSLDFHIGISAGSTFDAPAREWSFVSVPGRNGDIIIDNNKYQNIEVKYPCWIAHDLNKWLPFFRDFAMQFGDYQRLEDDYNPEYYRLGVLTGGLTVKTGTANRNANFDLAFNCKPQRFLKDGEEPIEISRNMVIYNPTLYESCPLIHVEGDGYFVINGQRTTIENNTVGVTIDCETGETFQVGATIAFDQFRLPRLVSGTNTIIVSGITKMMLTPRWWTL